MNATQMSSIPDEFDDFFGPDIPIPVPVIESTIEVPIPTRKEKSAEPPLHPAIDYLRGLFRQDDYIFFQLIHSTSTHIVTNKKTGLHLIDKKTGLPRTAADTKLLSLIKVKDAATPDFMKSLMKSESLGWNIYLCMNPFPCATTTRTEDLISDVRTIYLDVDKTKTNGERALQLIEASVKDGSIPPPTSILESSPGNYHVAWVVKDFSWDRGKALLPVLAARLGGDMAAIDLHRVLRMPGFKNLKKGREGFVCHLVSSLLNKVDPYIPSQFNLPVVVEERKKVVPSAEAVAKRVSRLEINAAEAQFELGDYEDRSDGGVSWIIECPWANMHEHGGSTAMLMVLGDGRPEFNCFHGHCNGTDGPRRGWSDIRNLWQEKVGHRQYFGVDDPENSFTSPFNPIPSPLTNLADKFSQATLSLLKDPLAEADEKARIRIVLENSNALLNSPEADPRIVVMDTIANLRRLEYFSASFPQPLTKKSLWGLMGDFVEIAYPTTVASREMILFQALPALGVVLGKKFYVPFGADRHYGTLWTLNIAKTADGKGSVKNIILSALEEIDSYVRRNGVKTNIASGEGLARVAYGTGILSAMTKLLWVMPEMAMLFNSMHREGSILSHMLREAYDCNQLENEKSDKKRSYTATNYLLGMMGTTSPAELRLAMPAIDWHNGIANRFLWNVGAKTKKLKTSRIVPRFDGWAERFRKVMDLNASYPAEQNILEYSADGLDCWNAWVDGLDEEDEESHFGLSQGRIKPNCLRAAVLYSVLDEERLEGGNFYLEPRHIEAGIEIVTRSAESTAYYLNMGSGKSSIATDSDIRRVHEAVAAKVRGGNQPELTRSEVTRMFRKLTEEQKDAVCLAAGMHLEQRRNPSGGAPADIWAVKKT